MPIKSDTTNSQSSSDELYINILNGTCDDECVRSVNPQDFTHFLDSFLFNSKCDKTKVEFFNIPCATLEGKNAIIHGILKTGIENFRTKNLFNFLGNYIKIHKDSLSEKNIEDLIFFTVHYDKAFRSKLILGETINNNDIITFSDFLYFFRNLLIIPNIKECDTRELIHTPNAEKLQNITFGELKSFEFVIGNTVELLNDFSVKLNSTANNFTEENLLSYLENAGALGFEFKIKEDFQFFAEQILHQTQQLLSSLSPRNYSDEFKKSVAWTFLSPYHHNHAEDIESDCQKLFGLENCLPPDDESTRLIFNKIRTSDLQSIDFSNTNYQLVIDKLSQGTSTNIETQLNELSHINKLTNIITFLKDYLKKNNPIDEAYVKKTFRLTSSLFNISNPNTTLLRNIENKLDIRFFKMIQAQIAFILNLVKHNSTGNHWFDKNHIISQLQNLTIAVIQSYEANKYSTNTDESVKNIPKSYLDIINYCKDVDSLLNEGSKSFANAIYKIAEACLLNPTVCNNKQIKQQSFEILGGMVRKFDRAHRNDLAKEVINLTKKLKDFIARSNTTTRELGDDVANFLRIRHSRNQVLMDNDCRELFGLNLIDCGFDTGNTTNVTFADPIPAIYPQEIVTTELPTSLNNTSFDQAGNTTTIDYANNDIIANQPFSLASKIGTAMGLGALTGFFNGGNQILLHIAEQKNCSLSTRRLLAVTLALANSFAISSLPLIYSIIENFGNEETDSLVNSQKLLTCTYAFITSVLLQTLNAGMQYALPKKSILKNLFNMLPLFAGLWMLANSEEGAIESFAILGTHILTSMAASLLTYFSFKQFVNQQPLHSKTFNPKVTNGFKKDVEEGAVEMENLTPEINVNKTKSARTFKYLTQENLANVRENSNLLKINLEQFIDNLKQSINSDETSKQNSTSQNLVEQYEKNIMDKKHVLNMLIEPSKIVTNLHECLTDDQHKAACLEYEDFKNFCNNMEKTANVFKLMQNFYEKTRGNNNLRDALNRACGYVEAQNKNFNSNTLQELTQMFDSLDTLLSPVRGFVNAYSTTDAGHRGEQLGEKNGKKQVLENLGKFQSSTNFFAASNDMKKRPYSMAGRPSSSGSDESGNSAYNPIDPQQITPLLNGTSCRV